MPYIILKYKDGYRVHKRDDVKKVFSKMPLSYEQAVKQMRAIAISEHSRKKK